MRRKRFYGGNPWHPLARVPGHDGCPYTRGVGLFLVLRVVVRLVRRDHRVIRAPLGCPCRPGVAGAPRAPRQPSRDPQGVT